MPSKSSVVLPSIHEMFPEHLMPSSSSSSNEQYSTPSSIAPHPHQPTLQDRRRSISDVTASSSRSIPLNRNPYLPPDAPPVPYASYPSPVTTTTSASRKSTDPPEYSFDVLRSDPSSSSLQHIASSATFPNRGTASSGYNPHGEVSSGMAPAFRVSVPETSTTSRLVPASHPQRSSSGQNGSLRKSPTGTQASVPSGPGYPSIISFPVTATPDGAEPSRAESPDAGNSSDGDLSSSNGKKHICPTCSKRFNRPSSLRIHINTHTGVTPFRCPWPNCGREFNVNSNMRRHYRNHTSPGFSRPHPSDARRRRRRQQSQELVFVSTTTTPSGTTPTNGQDQSVTSSISGHLHDPDDNVSEDEYMEEEEVDQLDAQMNMEPRAYPGEIQRSSPAYHHHSNPATHYTQSSIRESRPHTSSHGGERSHCASPLAGRRSPESHNASRDHIYSPSAPYIHSLTDTRVSTALRPAFRSHPVSPIDGR